MSDLIRREDAIKTLRKRWARTTSYDGIGEDIGEECEEVIEAIPSADRPQGWIPCSERLPEKEGHYLCSFKKANRIDSIYVDLAYWTGGRWYGYLANEINAWMPLPEPWKGAEDE